jgi:hypothetical protein
LQICYFDFVKATLARKKNKWVFILFFPRLFVRFAALMGNEKVKGLRQVAAVVAIVLIVCCFSI